MIIQNVIASNFGSYAHLHFSPANKGLSLIYGPTGSGKSTLPDVVSWTLFGVTAKNGNADDIRSWGAEGVTQAQVTVTLSDNSPISVVRVRGVQSKNDLYWVEEGDTKRGKDLNDTQRLLNERLGVDSNLFLTSAYFSDFSPTAGFFLASAKDRRKVFEQVTDLSFPVTLAEKITEKKKILKAGIKTCETDVAKLEGTQEALAQGLARTEHQLKEWDQETQETIESYLEKAKVFDTLKTSNIAALTTKSNAWVNDLARNLEAFVGEEVRLKDKLAKAQSKHLKCDTCGTVKGAEEVATIRGKLALVDSKINSLAGAVNPYEAQIEKATAEQNTNEDRAAELAARKNPHTVYHKEALVRIREHSHKVSNAINSLSSLRSKMSELDQLYDLSFALRGALLQSAVSAIEQKTNQHLETYFDSEFRVGFTIEDGDALEVTIHKGGHPCVYRQLSKGQRQLLKLSFAVSVMEAAANTAGVHFDNLFLDEPLDGLDESLKIKAFALLETLAQSHGSVFVIDHSVAFQEMFSNKYRVSLVGDISVIEAE